MMYRTITPADYTELSQVMKEAYAETPWNENWSDERIIRRVQAIIGNFQAMGICAVELVAADNKKILDGVLGYVYPYADVDFLLVYADYTFFKVFTKFKISTDYFLLNRDTDIQFHVHGF